MAGGPMPGDATAILETTMLDIQISIMNDLKVNEERPLEYSINSHEVVKNSLHYIIKMPENK